MPAQLLSLLEGQPSFGLEEPFILSAPKEQHIDARILPARDRITRPAGDPYAALLGAGSPRLQPWDRTGLQLCDDLVSYFLIDVLAGFHSRTLYKLCRKGFGLKGPKTGSGLAPPADNQFTLCPLTLSFQRVSRSVGGTILSLGLPLAAALGFALAIAFRLAFTGFARGPARPDQIAIKAMKSSEAGINHSPWTAFHTRTCQHGLCWRSTCYAWPYAARPRSHVDLNELLVA